MTQRKMNLGMYRCNKEIFAILKIHKLVLIPFYWLLLVQIIFHLLPLLVQRQSLGSLVELLFCSLPDLLKIEKGTCCRKAD